MASVKFLVFPQIRQKSMKLSTEIWRFFCSESAQEFRTIFHNLEKSPTLCDMRRNVTHFELSCRSRKHFMNMTSEIPIRTPAPSCLVSIADASLPPCFKSCMNCQRRRYQEEEPINIEKQRIARSYVPKNTKSLNHKKYLRWEKTKKQTTSSFQNEYWPVALAQHAKDFLTSENKFKKSRATSSPFYSSTSSDIIPLAELIGIE